MRLREEKGAALVVSLFALSIVGALVAAIFVVAVDEQRVGGQALRTTVALGSGEVTLANRLRESRPNSNAVFFLDVTASDRAHVTRRRLGLLARLRPPRLIVTAALTTSGTVRLVDGANLTAVQEDSCSPSGGQTVPLQETSDPLAGLDYAELAAAAHLDVAPGAYAPLPATTWDGTCDTTVATNWGDGVTSAGPCAGVGRVVHVRGNLDLVSGRGSGVLLVDGDLVVSGPVEYTGLIVVRGRFETRLSSTTPAILLGAAIVANPGAAEQRLAGNVQMSYSNCTVRNALRLMARPTQLDSRGWIELF
jgi:hypothetical protein